MHPGQPWSVASVLAAALSLAGPSWWLGAKSVAPVVEHVFHEQFPKECVCECVCSHNVSCVSEEATDKGKAPELAAPGIQLHFSVTLFSSAVSFVIGCSTWCCGRSARASPATPTERITRSSGGKGYKGSLLRIE